jgi:hypothetical protein
MIVIRVFIEIVEFRKLLRNPGHQNTQRNIIFNKNFINGYIRLSYIGKVDAADAKVVVETVKTEVKEAVVEVKAEVKKAFHWTKQNKYFIFNGRK